MPVVARQPVQVPHNKPIADGHLADQLYVTVEFSSETVHESKFSFFQAKQRDIRVRAEGRVDAAIGTQASGQGHETSFAQVVADILQVPLERVVEIMRTRGHSPTS